MCSNGLAKESKTNLGSYKLFIGLFPNLILSKTISDIKITYPFYTD